MRRRRAIKLEKPMIEDPDISLASIVSSQDSQPDEARGGSEMIHGSGLVTGNFCARREWLIRKGYSPPPRRVWGAMRIVWSLGRAAEKHVRDQLLKVMLGNAWGRWGCRCGYVEPINRLHIEAIKCPKCRRNCLDEYYEAHLQLPIHRQQGSPDFVWMIDGKLNVAEIKSMNKKDFDKLERVKADHANQGLLYRSYLDRLGYPVGKVKVFMVSKDYGIGSPYKEFDIEKPIHTPVTDLAISLAESSFTEEIPDRIHLCSSHESSRAKGCDACVACFMD